VAAAGAAALAVAVFPRVAWIASAAALVVGLAAGGTPGVALVLAAALAPVPFLLPRAGLLWSVPALAPLLGVAGLAPAYAALCGLASTAWRRAALGALGVGWLVAAEVITGKLLLFGPPDGREARAAWEGSALGAGHHALGPVVTSPALAPTVLFAAAALLLPVLVRGRSLGLDVLGAAVWAGAFAFALGAVPFLSQPRGALAGALVGGAIAVAAGELGLVPPPGKRHDVP
jgi:hypothetical protein